MKQVYEDTCERMINLYRDLKEHEDTRKDVKTNLDRLCSLSDSLKTELKF